MRDAIERLADLVVGKLVPKTTAMAHCCNEFCHVLERCFGCVQGLVPERCSRCDCQGDYTRQCFIREICL